jgi:alpha-tubulin suppressor-like RCC1 family protein
MAIQAQADIVYSGGTLNDDPILSLGGDPSIYTVPVEIQNVFSNITSSSTIDGITDYRMLYITNTGTAPINELYTSLIKALNTPAELSLGYFLINEQQRFVFANNPSSGTITFTYKDIFNNSYILNAITWTNSTDLAFNLQSQLNELVNANGQAILGGVSCATTPTTPDGFVLLITFAGASGNKYHNLLTQTNSFGVDINSNISIVGGPINIVPPVIANPTAAPSDIIFYTANPNDPIFVGTLLNNPSVPGQGEYLPVWIKRVVPPDTQPQELAGSTLKITGLVYPNLPTPTITGSPGNTPSPTPTPTTTTTPSPTPTPSGTGGTPSPTPSVSNSATPTPTPTFSATPTPTNTASPSPTPSPTATRSPTTLYVWGSAINGGIDMNVATGVFLTPVQAAAGKDYIQLRMGLAPVGGAITNTGQLWTWGTNSGGMLGNGNTNNQSSIVQVTNSASTNWATTTNSFGFGYNHGVALASDGYAWSWGNNNLGQLGTNTGAVGARSTPVTILGGNIYTAITAGFGASMALTKDGKIYTWGYGSFGGLGVGDAQSKSSPVQILDIGWKQPTGNTNTISMGYHALAIANSNGFLYGWGLNNSGQLGNGTTASTSNPIFIDISFVTVAAGGYHSAGIKSNGTLWAWGQNNLGQLGINSDINQSEPVQVEGSWANVACGEYNTLAIKDDGRIYGWGFNTNKQVGSNLTNLLYVSSPILVSSNETNWKQIASSNAGAAAI